MSRQVQISKRAAATAAARRRRDHDEPEIEPRDLRDPDLADDTDECLDAIDAALEADE